MAEEKPSPPAPEIRNERPPVFRVIDGKEKQNQNISMTVFTDIWKKHF